jgi:hypothetical protein
MNDSLEIPSLVELAPDPFVQRLERLAWIYSQIEAAFGVERQVLTDESLAARDKDPESFQEWQHLIYDERETDVDECEELRAELVLVSLAQAVKGLLTEAEKELRRIIPGSSVERMAGSKNGKKVRGSVRDHFITSFQMLGIDLALGPGWRCADEVLLARDAVVHPQRPVEYMEYRNRRFLSASGEFVLGGPQLDTTLKDLQEFAAWLRQQIKARHLKTGT